MLKKRRGFTLIELLVVIAIIAILAAILMPVFARSRIQAQQARCVSNLKALWTAWRLYADDYDGRFPQVRVVMSTAGGGPGPNWCGAQEVGSYCFLRSGSIWRYTRNLDIYLCPLDRGRSAVNCTKLSPDEQKKYPLSYSANWTLSWKRSETLPSGKLRHMMMIIHEARTTINDGDFNWAGTDIPDDVHFDGTTMVYVDGHANRVSADQIMAERYECYDARSSPYSYE